MDYFDEEGHLEENWITWYVNALHTHRLDKVPEEIKDHLEECAFCAGLIVQLTDYYRQNPEEIELDDPEIPVRAGLWSRTNRFARKDFILKLAAVVLIPVLIGAVWLISSLNKNTRQEVVQTRPVLPDSTLEARQAPVSGETQTRPAVLPEKNKLLAANFTELPYMEEIIKVNQRASGFLLLTPEKEVLFNDSLLFSWKPVKGKVEICIRNNKDSTLLEAELAGEKWVLRNAFKPGLYYWIISHNQDAVAAGKFRKNP